MSKLLTPKDVQEKLNIGKNTVYKLFHLQGFPKVQIGKKYYVEEEELYKYIHAHVKSTIHLD